VILPFFTPLFWYKDIVEPQLRLGGFMEDEQKTLNEEQIPSMGTVFLRFMVVGMVAGVMGFVAGTGFYAAKNAFSKDKN
jgi:hypothetical protein